LACLPDCVYTCLWALHCSAGLERKASTSRHAKASDCPVSSLKVPKPVPWRLTSVCPEEELSIRASEEGMPHSYLVLSPEGVQKFTQCCLISADLQATCACSARADCSFVLCISTGCILPAFACCICHLSLPACTWRPAILCMFCTVEALPGYLPLLNFQALGCYLHFLQRLHCTLPFAFLLFLRGRLTYVPLHSVCIFVHSATHCLPLMPTTGRCLQKGGTCKA